MKKIIKLTESDLVKLVREIIKEQTEPTPSDNTEPTEELKKEDVVKCTDIGVYKRGYCNKKTKQTIDRLPCSFIGMKYPGMCYGITGIPVLK